MREEKRSMEADGGPAVRGYVDAKLPCTAHKTITSLKVRRQCDVSLHRPTDNNPPNLNDFKRGACSIGMARVGAMHSDTNSKTTIVILQLCGFIRCLLLNEVEYQRLGSLCERRIQCLALRRRQCAEFCGKSPRQFRLDVRDKHRQRLLHVLPVRRRFAALGARYQRADL